jgi:methionyl aminopeptidase
VDQVTLKTEEDIAWMAKGGKRLAQIRDLLIKKAQPGVRTIDLDYLAEKEILAFGGFPSFKTVKNYRFTICTSINEEVVHGIPSGRRLREGDVVGIDLGMVWQGWHTDTAWTVVVTGPKAQISQEVEKFLRTGQQALAEAIRITKVGSRIGYISQVIQKTIEGAGYSPVKILTGHGVGRNLHEDPAIPQILLGKIGKTAKIIPGMTLAIEVIYNQGIAEVFQKDDGWTIVTADGKISATFEKTIAVRDSGVLVLTP